MSQRPHASEPVSNCPVGGARDAAGQPAREARPRQELSNHAADLPASAGLDQRRAMPKASGPENHASSTWGSARKSSGLHDILNPTPSHRTSSVPMTQGSDGLRSHPPSLNLPPTTSNDTGRRQSSPSPGLAEGLAPLDRPIMYSGQAPRRILTPQSPALRSASLGRLSLPGTIDAQKSPFLSTSRRSQVDMASPQGAEVPPLPTPPALSRLSGSSYGFPPTAPTPPSVGRRASVGTKHGPPSLTASPSTSYSSFSQVSHASPSPRTTQPTSAPHLPPSFGASAGGGPVPVSVSPPYKSPASSLAQSSYQLLTLDTDQGPIQVPVDVQAASKMADDKRKRNAGASARFRQRRKEKEREASQTIARLEQQIRDITAEREFYRQERDHFRLLVSSGPISGHLPSRPPSPRHQGPMSIPWPNPATVEEDDREAHARPSVYGAPVMHYSYSRPPPASDGGGAGPRTASMHSPMGPHGYAKSADADSPGESTTETITSFQSGRGAGDNR
ncbi:MAG: hypothetical protein M1817_000163 [Caeruleum heppii]|nr:MAG: hypothetical protein M1817_000163 [Caeruleum heppii]